MDELRTRTHAEAGGRMEHRVGGLHQVVSSLRELLVWPKQFAHLGKKLGVTWPTGLLLHGPPGTGKSLVVRTAADESNAILKTVIPSTIFGSFVGESERKLRQVFESVDQLVQKGETVILFFDEIDALCPRRDRSGPYECRLVAQMLTLMDSSASKIDHNRRMGIETGILLLVGASNCPNSIDPAIRRPGRLEREITVGMPNEADRLDILKIHLNKLSLSNTLQLKTVAQMCSGFTGADISVLCHEAVMNALAKESSIYCTIGDNEGAQGASSFQLTLEDFEEAKKNVRPTVTRGLLSEFDPVSWDEICGLEKVKEELRRVVQWPFQFPEAFERLGLQSFRGALLYGPPGCCKTKLCRAVASATGVPMISLSCAEVMSMYVGESEDTLRNCFAQARLSSPAILFLDEFDAFCSKRGAESASVSDNILATFLIEMDGLEQIDGVIVLAATNRPEEIDEALLRPGRFDVLLYVPPPSRDERLQLLQHLTTGMNLQETICLEQIANKTSGFSGAELEALCREALIGASFGVSDTLRIDVVHFENALASITPHLTENIVQKYENFNCRNT